MYKKLVGVLFLTLFLFINTHAAESTDKINLKWQFEKDKKFTLKGNLHFDGSADIPLQMLVPQQPPAGVDGLQQQTITAPEQKGTEKAAGNLDLDLVWNVLVKDVDDQGNADLQITVIAANVKALGKLGSQEIKYEANLLDPIVPGPDGVAQPLIKSEDTIHIWRVAPNGKVLAINGQDINATVAEINKQLNDAGIKVKEEEIRSLADMFMYFMASYPADPVNIGQNWIRKVDLSNLLTPGTQQDGIKVSNFQFSLQQDWTVKNNDGKVITLEEKSNAMPKFEMALDGPEATVKVNVTGVESGQIKVDNEHGLVRSTNQELTLTGQMDAQEKTGNNQTYQIPFELKMKSNFSLSE